MPSCASVSPYALLRASMPKQNAASTAYDLYSLAQSAPNVSVPPDASPVPSAPERPRGGEPAPNVSAPPNASAPPERDALPPRARIPAGNIPAKRTHYIADIQNRHQAALKRASLTAPKG